MDGESVNRTHRHEGGKVSQGRAALTHPERFAMSNPLLHDHLKYDRLYPLLADYSGVTGFNDETALAAKDGLDLDSLDLIQLAMKVEEEFEIELPDEEVDKPELGTVGGLLAYIEERYKPATTLFNPPDLATVGRALDEAKERIEQATGIRA